MENNLVRDKDQAIPTEFAEGVSIPVDIDQNEVEVTEKLENEELNQLKQQLQEKNKELNKLHDSLLRKQAELENYRKRMQKEKTELVKFAVEGLISDLLPIMDDFERAIEATNSSHDPQTLREGIKLIFDQLQAVLNKAGLEGVNALGEEFDPTKHEAVRLIESHEHEDSIVLEEMRKGYTLNKRILRPSMVAVSKKKKTVSAKTRVEETNYSH
jgi:molecular chaperone GrpE